MRSEPLIGGIGRLYSILREDFNWEQEIVYHHEQFRLRSAAIVRFGVDWWNAKSSGCKLMLYLHPHLARFHKVTRSKMPYGVITHGVEIQNDHSATLKKILSGAEFIICSTRYMHELITEKYGELPLHQAYYPTIRFKKKKEPSEKSENCDFIVLMVGRMDKRERYKGHDEVMEAWAALEDDIPAGKLIFVGSGSDEERLKMKAKKWNVNSRMYFAGQVSDQDLRDWYQLADVFVLPSSGEGQGLVYLEALQMGLPLIALKNSPARELAGESAGYLLGQQSPDDVAEALLALYKNRNLRNRLGENAAKRFKEMNIRERFNAKLSELMGSN